MSNYIERASTILQRINELATVTELPGTVTRTFGTYAFLEGSRKVMNWMTEAGLPTHIDNMGNVHGKLMSNTPGAKTLVIASHIDTVVNAGKFDGPLGVLMGLDCLEQLIASQTNLPFHIELIAFSDEEGVRFHTTYLGSKVVAGTFDTSLLATKDGTGISLQEAISNMGGDVTQLKHDNIKADDWLGYFEIHIEQGPVLYEKNIPVAIVKAIAGQRRMELRFSGEAGHAGTVPMHMRNDALCCAAEFVLEVERFAKTNPGNVVATIGTLQIPHAASNVIPGEVVCTLDLRSDNNNTLTACFDTIKKTGESIAARRNIQLRSKVVQETTSLIMDAALNSSLAKAISEAGYEVIELVSGAGHDAVAIAPVAPVCMLFVRCYKGISHNPQEDVELKDIAAALEVSGNFIDNLIQNHNQG
jgi:allantoate deiminase